MTPEPLFFIRVYDDRVISTPHSCCHFLTPGPTAGCGIRKQKEQKEYRRNRHFIISTTTNSVSSVYLLFLLFPETLD